MQPGSSSTRIPRFDPNYVRIVGDSVGVTNLTPPAFQLAANQLSYILLKIIQSANGRCLHGRRIQLVAEDIEAALKERQLTPPLGYTNKYSISQRLLTMPSGEELYINEDREVDVPTLADTRYLKYPLAPYVKAHWLVLDGKIPQIPENVRVKTEQEEEEAEEDLSANASNNAKAAQIAMRRETAGGQLGAAVSFRSSTKGLKTKELIVVKPPVIESLSVEQQMYVREIVEACVGQDDVRRHEALHSLEIDTGLHAVLPRLASMLSYSIRCNVIHHCLSMLIYLMRMIRSISLNKSVKLQPYLHELIPCIMTCMMARQLCVRPETDNHWALRDYAAKTLSIVVKEHGVSHLRDRIFRSCWQVLCDRGSSPASIYGCLSPTVEYSQKGMKYDVLSQVISLIGHYKTLPTDSVENEKVLTILQKYETILRRQMPISH